MLVRFQLNDTPKLVHRSTLLIHSIVKNVVRINKSCKKQT